MAYQYFVKIGKIQSGSTFHSFSTNTCKIYTLENRLHLGNFYHTINLKGFKLSAMNKIVKRVYNEVGDITVWEE